MRIASLIIALLALTGCCTLEKHDAHDASLGAINEICPMTQEPVDPNVDTVAYGEHQIGFCCSGCVAGWERMSDAERDRFVSAYANE